RTTKTLLVILRWSVVPPCALLLVSVSSVIGEHHAFGPRILVRDVVHPHQTGVDGDQVGARCPAGHEDTRTPEASLLQRSPVGATHQLPLRTKRVFRASFDRADEPVTLVAVGMQSPCFAYPQPLLSHRRDSPDLLAAAVVRQMRGAIH